MSDTALGDRERLAEIDPALGRGTRLPLAAVLLAVVLVVALVPLAFFSLLTRSEMKDALVAGEQERQLRLAGTIAMQLDGFVDQVGREAVKIGDAVASLGDVDTSGRPPNLGTFLDETVVLARFQPVSGTAASAMRELRAMKAELVMPLSIEQSLAQDARTILEQGATAAPGSARAALLGGPYAFGPERILAVTVSAPVQRHNELLGVFQEVALFHKAWEEAASNVASSMQLFLLRPDGSLAAVAPVGRTDDIARTLKQRDTVQQFMASHGNSRGARAFTVTGGQGGARRVLGSFAATKRGWGVFVEVDEKLALAPVARFTRMLTWGALLAAVLAAGAAWLTGRVISSPVTRLAQISKRLADRDFSVQAAASPIAELDMLGINFNRMATRLGELVELLRTGAREANDMFLGTIRALAEAIDEKDPYTKGHSVRVNRYAVIIGRYLGLSREEMRALQISSLLHDVGKIGIDDAILKKPAALTPEEFMVMKTHPERGAKIMGRIPQMKNMIAGMRFHHERYSGGGYPLGLKHDEIPLQARIIAVADTLDAMITDRPYQRAFPVPEAVAKINDMKGKTLDPQVVEAFNRAYKAGEFDDLFAPPAEPGEPAAASASASASASAGAGAAVVPGPMVNATVAPAAGASPTLRTPAAPASASAPVHAVAAGAVATVRLDTPIALARPVAPPMPSIPALPFDPLGPPAPALATRAAEQVTPASGVPAAPRSIPVSAPLAAPVPSAAGRVTSAIPVVPRTTQAIPVMTRPPVAIPVSPATTAAIAIQPRAPIPVSPVTSPAGHGPGDDTSAS